MLAHINKNKLTEGRSMSAAARQAAAAAAAATDDKDTNLVGEESGRIKWIQPSGTAMWHGYAMSTAVPTDTLCCSCSKISMYCWQVVACIICQWHVGTLCMLC